MYSVDFYLFDITFINFIIIELYKDFRLLISLICDFEHNFYSGLKADRVKVSVALSNFFSFWGRDGPRDKTSGHELLFSVSFFVLGWYELRFLSCHQIL